MACRDAGAPAPALAHVARLLAMLLLAAVAGAQQLVRVDDVAAQCPVSVTYDVNLGESGSWADAGGDVPIFVGGMVVHNNAPAGARNATIKDWELGWDFPFGSSIQTDKDLFDLKLRLSPDPSPLGVVVHTNSSGGLSRPIAAQQSLQFGFLGTKGGGDTNASNPFNVGAVYNMSFNNLRCIMVDTTPRGSSSFGTLEVAYTPIEYVEQPLVNSFSQFLLRVRNVQNSTTVDLSKVGLQYWFEGPEQLPPGTEAAPWDFFSAQCEYSTVSCESVRLGFARGVDAPPGARFLLSIDFTNSSGLLLPSGENAVPALFLGKGLDVVDLLLTLTTKPGVALFNSTQDYSFLDTPQLDVDLGDTNTTIVPRLALPNPRLPAYLSGKMAWGTPPTMAGHHSAEMHLPPGIVCQPGTNASRSACGLAAVYCCRGPDPLELSIPKEFPPPLVLAVDGTAAPTPTMAPEPDSSGGGSSSAVAVAAGAASGVVAALALAGAVLFVVVRRRRQRAHAAGGALLGRKGSKDLDPDQMEAGGCGSQPSLPDGGGGSSSGIKSVRPGQGAEQALLTPVHVLMGPTGDAGSWVSSSSPSRSPHHRSASHPNPGALRSHALIKYPSGMSAMSGASTIGSGSNPGGDPQYYDDGTATQHGASLGVNGSQPATPSPVNDHNSRGGGTESVSGFPPELLAMLERKSCTAPSIFFSDASASRKRRQDAAASRGCEDPDDLGDLASPEDLSPAPWQLLPRSKSWAGVVLETQQIESVPLHVLRRRKSSPSLAGALPALTQLPPPLLPGGGPADDVDLNVDFEAEVAPYLGRCLGTGGFGAVYECTWRGRRVAVKRLPQLAADQPGGQVLKDALIREIGLASKFASDRLVRVFGACTSDPEHLALIMELEEGGNLFQRIYDRTRRRLSYVEILQLTHDMAAGLAYLHPSVVHRDLKPQNVLLDMEGRAKLADFGISRVKDPTKSYLTQVTNDNGTPLYMAPEMFNGTRLDEKADVYALGVILNECYTRRQPWRDSSSHFFQIILKVAINGERPWLDPDCPEPLRRLITKCWHQDPHMRPSCAEIMRLTELLLQEEIMRWEQLQHPNGRHVGQLRLPSGPRVGGAPADRSTPKEPASASADGDVNSSSKAGQAAAAGAAPAGRAAPSPRKLDLSGLEEAGR